MSVPSDIEIAQAATLRPITDVAAEIGLGPDDLDLYGKYKAKVSLDIAARPPKGKLVIVTAINPTAAGEGKTTTSVGLAQALRKIGTNAVLCIREPSLGPVFGVKGGAAGGGYAQVLPMDDINLHFTGDFHAISSAHARFWRRPNARTPVCLLPTLHWPNYISSAAMRRPEGTRWKRRSPRRRTTPKCF